MKITKLTIQQIIKEELEAELHEQQLIHESIFRTLFNALKELPSGFLQNIKEWMAGKVMSVLGIAEEGTPFHKIAVNFFGNLEMDDLAAMMSGDRKCIALTSELAGGFTEFIAEKVPEMLGVESSGWFAGAYRESLGEEFLNNLNQNIGTAICELNFSKLFGKGEPNEETINEIKKMLQEESSKYIRLREEKKEKMDIEKMNLKKGRCTPMGTSECPEGSPQYNLANRFKGGDIRKDNFKKGKNPQGPG